jgi:hypothetical protein
MQQFLYDIQILHSDFAQIEDLYQLFWTDFTSFIS